MRRGFFSPSVIAQGNKAPASRVPKCGACGLLKTCKSPKMPIAGKGKRGILIVGEAPGETEDDTGKPFVGKSGRLLQQTLRKYGIDMFRDCWVTNSLICRPPGNRDPTDLEIGYCRPNLLNAITDLKPSTIIPLGRFGIESVIGMAWKSGQGDVGGGYRWLGWNIPYRKWNAWICPTYHPAFIARKLKENGVESLFFEKHLEKAAELEGRPWESNEFDDRSQIEKIYDANEAARILRRMIQKGGPVAFDYETNCLKPDRKEARIVSCSVSWRGKKTIAYPWHGEAITATGELLQSPLPKIASNLKFEERWTIAEFGRGVKNWSLDTMLEAHVMDYRPQITSIKFQAFVQLGVEDWSSHIEPFLASDEKGGNGLNRIHEIAIGDLLLYNGLDSLWEYGVAKKQVKESKHVSCAF